MDSSESKDDNKAPLDDAKAPESEECSLICSVQKFLLNCGSSTIDSLKSLGELYNDSLRRNPLATKAITSCIITIIGEIIGAYIKNRNSLLNSRSPFKKILNPSQPTFGQLLYQSMSAKRIATFGTLGLCFVGPVFHYWYGYLEKITDFIVEKLLKFCSKSCAEGENSQCKLSLLKVLVKLSIQQLIFYPPYLLCTLSAIQLLLTGGNGPEVIKSVKNTYAAALIASWKLWTPAQLANFTMVPLQYRVLFGNVVAVWWNIYLSLVS